MSRIGLQIAARRHRCGSPQHAVRNVDSHNPLRRVRDPYASAGRQAGSGGDVQDALTRLRSQQLDRLIGLPPVHLAFVVGSGPPIELVRDPGRVSAGGTHQVSVMLLGSDAVRGAPLDASMCQAERDFVSDPAASGSSGVDGRHAEGQRTRLDLGLEGGGLADHVAVELVVVFSVELDSHLLSSVLVDLVILLGAPGYQP